jgi:hypothetical protein
MTRPFVILLAGAALAACSKRPEVFNPAGPAEGVSPKGERASVHDVVIEGRVMGEAMVWSDGARRKELPARGTRTVVHVGLVIESHHQPLRLAVEEVALPRVVLDDEVLHEVLPALILGDAEIPAGTVERFDFYFEMKTDPRPQEVDAFVARWVVTDERGHGRYAQQTAFVDDPWLRFAGDDSRSYPPYYEPFVVRPHFDQLPPDMNIPTSPMEGPQAER